MMKRIWRALGIGLLASGAIILLVDALRGRAPVRLGSLWHGLHAPSADVFQYWTPAALWSPLFSWPASLVLGGIGLAILLLLRLRRG
ncbi:MAG TPA: hypothetical protein VED40_21590 [Azospirillaceae bacterium]|nr:hypothetical protein [Azospirillaceae bacterium]